LKSRNGLLFSSVERSAGLPTRRPKRPLDASTRGHDSRVRELAWQALPVVLLGLACSLWFASLPAIDLRKLTDLGLIAVLQPLNCAGLVLLTIGFCLALRPSSPAQGLLGLHVLALIVMLFGIAPMLQEAPRLESTWKHLGIVDNIQRTEQVDPLFDAYFNWPSFFVMAAAFNGLSGNDSLMSLVKWAPLALNLLYFGPLLKIFQASTGNYRHVWLAIWLFYLGNWIGQDYFSPQGLSYFLYLIILGVLIQWFQAPAHTWLVSVIARRWDLPRQLGRLAERGRAWSIPDGGAPPALFWQRASLVLLVLVVYAAMVPSHQLTPFIVLESTITLVVFNQCRLRGLPVAMGILLVGWLAFMATPYLAGHLQGLVRQIGLDVAVSANVTGRLQGSPEHVAVLYVRMAFALGFWGLAFLGGIRRLHHRYLDLTLALLAVAPFFQLLAQSYGGEMLLRIYLFVLPFMAFFVAAVFFPSPATTGSWRILAAVGGLSVLLAGGFFISRHGNERMDFFTTSEVQAMQHLYAVTPPNSLFLAGGIAAPWKHQRYVENTYQYLVFLPAWQGRDRTLPPAEVVTQILQSNAYRDRYAGIYVVLTRSQAAHAELFGFEAPGWADHLAASLMTSDRFRLIYSNDDAQIFMLTTEAG
jgi:hypothetical protein